MAAPFLPLLLLSILTSTTSRSLTSKHHATDLSTTAPGGPIKTNGKYYGHVCHPARFADLGLDMREFIYCDQRYSYQDRVKDLVGAMSLDEKVRQLGNMAKGVPRIGLPPYAWWSEALHGVADVMDGAWFGDVVPGATSFPNVINSAATFNESLWKAIGQAVSTEARAMHNLGHANLTFWSPNINVVRDPRWGRILETPGEDPYVVGRYAVNYVRGLQDVEGHEIAEDPDSRPLKVSSCCKHYAAYDLDSWFGHARESYDARVTEQDMVETFLRPFEMCVKDGDAASVMCSYNQVNGIPTCANPRLLSQTIRGDWELHGYIVSDCDSVQVMVTNQGWLGDTPADAVSQAMNAGLDLDCGDYYPDFAGQAVAQGKVREKDIDNALKNLYTVLMRLGFFDGMPMYEKLGKNDVCSQDHIELGLDAARQSMVLLKNIGNTLPLSKQKQKKLALGGTHVNARDVMLGNYNGIPCHFVSPQKAFTAEAEVEVELGCDLWCRNQQAREHMKQLSQNADATILFMGLDTSYQHAIEREGLDRNDLLLPQGQVQFIKEVAQASKAPVILVILSAGGVDISFAMDDPKIGAILWAGYPGQDGGSAIADVVYGRYNPAGRLPITWYTNDYINTLPMTSMPLRPIPELGYPGRTYKFYDGPTLYPFGYGLSYTQFNHTLKPPSQSSINVKLGPYQKCLPVSYEQNVTAPPCPSANVVDLACEEEIELEVEVTNVGRMDGSNVVIVYSAPPKSIAGAPLKQVVAFQRVFVRAGNSAVANFSINVCKSFEIVETTAYRVLPSGEHTILVGDANFPIQLNLVP